MKNKLVIIAIAIVLAVTILIGSVAAIALSGSYLDSLKDYDFSQYTTYNGIEILEKDGLFYLTRDGKKISRKGYETLTSVHEAASGDHEPEELLAMKDFEIFDYYVATKSGSNGCFLVDGEGNEYKIENEGLIMSHAMLPFLMFVDPLTKEQAVISLRELNSDLSECVDGVIKIKNTYERIEPHTDSMNEKYLTSSLELYNTDEAPNAPTCTFVGQDGKILFVSPEGRPSVYRIVKDETVYEYFKLADNSVVSINGTVIATDVIDVEQESEEMIIVTCDKYEKPDERKAILISAKAVLTFSASEYDLNTAAGEGVLVNVALKSSGEYKLFNLATGETLSGYKNLTTVSGYGKTAIARAQLTTDESTYAYFDAQTGAELYRGKYGDMYVYMDGVLCSASEAAQRIDGKTPLHFVSSGKKAVDFVLDSTESLSIAAQSENFIAYELTATTPDPVNAVSIVKRSFIQPFAEGSTQSASYDTLQTVKVFADGAPVVIAKDYTAGKVDFIDAASAKVVYTVDADGAAMAKLSIGHDTTTALVADNTTLGGVVEIAVFSVTFTNDAGDIDSRKLVAFNRTATVGEDGDYVTADLVATEISTNPFPDGAVIASESVHYGYDYAEYLSFTKYLAVRNADKTSTVYTLDESLKPVRVSEIPYIVYDIRSYGDNLANAYLLVTNESQLMGAYSVDGKQLLPITHELVTVYGEFAIAEKKGAYGLYKLDFKKGDAKLVLDFKYDHIEHVIGDAFITTEADEMYLYEGGDRVKKDRIVGNVLTGNNLSIDEETGKLITYDYFVVNIDGRLYIHRDEPREVTFTDNFKANALSGNVSINNGGVVAINFHNADGSFIETRVLYKTALSQLKFEMPQGTWHSTGVKDLQNSSTVVTKETIILNEYSGVLALYMAHPAD